MYMSYFIFKLKLNVLVRQQKYYFFCTRVVACVKYFLMFNTIELIRY